MVGEEKKWKYNSENGRRGTEMDIRGEYPNKPNCIENSSSGKVMRLTCNIKIQHVFIFNKFLFYKFFQ